MTDLEQLIEKPVVKKSRSKNNTKKLNTLLDDNNQIINDSFSVTENNNYYKNKLKVYVLSGQIKDLYGKIITENELNNLSDQECENIYKICELKVAKKISDSVIDGIVSVIGNICSRTLPIDNKDKYITELKNDYIINSELKNIAGNVAMRTGKFMGLLSFLVITVANINLSMKQIDKEIDKESQEIKQELCNEIDKELIK